MNCQCELPAKHIICRDGKPAYTCGQGRCRFYAIGPVTCSGYTRVLSLASTPTGVCILRFEALLHPMTRQRAFVVVCQGAIIAELRSVLQSPATGVAWHLPRGGYIYPMEQYAPLLAALRQLPAGVVLVEEIPSFFFTCTQRTTTAELQAKAAPAAAGYELDPEDVVVRQLKPFQRAGVAFILAHGGRGMIADDMGLGKTVQAIAVAHHFRDEWPVLVMCPMSLMENWAKEFNRFCGIPFSRIVVLQGAKARATGVHQVVIVSYSSLKCVEAGTFAVVILDESHYIKAGDSKRSQLALTMCRAASRVLLLSGTPAMSRPIELYAQLQAIHPALTPSRTQYGARYCNAYVSRFGIDMTGHSHSDELHVLLQGFVIRRTKKELGDELPSKSRQLLYVYVTEKERKALAKRVGALSASMAAGAGAGDWSSRAPNAFELKIATARAKIPAVQDYVSSAIEQHFDSGEKIIFFAHHQCMMEAIKSAVEGVRPKQPVDYIYITGETPAVQREQLAEHFRSEPTCAVAVLSMQSSGTGHNFTCATTVVFAELDWNPSTHLQCEDRVHRIGQANPCAIKYLLAEGTSDSVIWPLLQSKLTVTTAMLESNDELKTDCKLDSGAGTGKVTRRDVSPLQASSQSTLDSFMRGSQKSDSAGSQKPSLGVRLGADSTEEQPEAGGTTSCPSAAPDGGAGAAKPIVIAIAAMEQLKLQVPPQSTGMASSRHGTAGKLSVASKSAPGTTTAATSVMELMHRGGAVERTQAGPSDTPVHRLSLGAPPVVAALPFSVPTASNLASPPAQPLINLAAILDRQDAAASRGTHEAVPAPRRTVYTLASMRPVPSTGADSPALASPLHQNPAEALQPMPQLSAPAMTATGLTPNTILRVPIVTGIKRPRSSSGAGPQAVLQVPLSVSSQDGSAPPQAHNQVRVAVPLPSTATCPPHVSSHDSVHIPASNGAPRTVFSVHLGSTPHTAPAPSPSPSEPAVLFNAALLARDSSGAIKQHSTRTTFQFRASKPS